MPNFKPFKYNLDYRSFNKLKNEYEDYYQENFVLSGTYNSKYLVSEELNENEIKAFYPDFLDHYSFYDTLNISFKNELHEQLYNLLIKQIPLTNYDVFTQRQLKLSIYKYVNQCLFIGENEKTELFYFVDHLLNKRNKIQIKLDYKPPNSKIDSLMTISETLYFIIPDTILNYHRFKENLKSNVILMPPDDSKIPTTP